MKECEALALFEALFWALSLDFQRVIFESDVKLVIDAIYSFSND